MKMKVEKLRFTPFPPIFQESGHSSPPPGSPPGSPVWAFLGVLPQQPGLSPVGATLLLCLSSCGLWAPLLLTQHVMSAQ